MSEKTLSLIKPDAVERNLIGKIIQIFEDNGLVVEEMKKVHIDLEFAKNFYSTHSKKPFYNDLCNYICSGPLVALVLRGDNAIQINRDLMGSTNPKEAKSGTIRNLYALSIDKNSVHGSDSHQNAQIEIDLFFNIK
ncbi:MAG: nucleoside-diphosphate kinase [Candidatus Pelagibacter sp.]|nr:nucleoside-diphosphate kinase [Candidatus Pelagibacter sp.]OUV87382.1 MAG: nucleoside-diphosphate kinase [Pelagibacteraceae bacterium TMED136]|tara:strand:+ start:65 stop:472 length:408 start_codon:yes stop_codon:yes gene_type:complete